MTKVRIKNVKSVKVKIEPEKKVYTKVPLYLRPHKLHEHEDASDLAVSTEGQLIRKSGNNWVAFTPEYYEDKNRTPGAVLFAGADGKISEDNANFRWDSTLKSINLGGLPPSYISSSAQGQGIYLEKGDGTNTGRVTLAGYTNQLRITFARFFGTKASPLNVAAGTILGGLNGGTVDTNGNYFENQVISLATTDVWSSTARGIGVQIRTTNRTDLNSRVYGITSNTFRNYGTFNFVSFPERAALDFGGLGTTSATWTAQFHNSTLTSNSLMINDNGFTGFGLPDVPNARVHIRGSSSLSGNALLVEDSTPSTLLAVLNNGLVGIGNNNPKASLDISGNSAKIWIEQNSASPTIVGFRNQGTRNSPLPPSKDNALFEIAAGGWNGSGFVIGRRASIRFIATENWTSTANGSEMLFYVTRNGGLSNGVPMALKQNSTLVLGTLANNITPQDSAQLQIDSTTRGFLPPRMTEAQKNAISLPAEGLLVYQNDGTKGWYGYDGFTWIKLN